MMPSFQIIVGDCIESMRTMPDASVQCCVTSPPYFGLRDYGHTGQIGLEATPDAFVAKMVEVFEEVRRVLKDDGTLWLNLGDSYNAYNGGAGPSSSLSRGAQTTARPQLKSGYGLKFKGLKPKDLIGIPWRVAFALQTAGWYLRQDIIWHKPNPMPESVTDRCTKAHEYIFLLTKSERYYYDAESIKEPIVSKAPSGNGFKGRQGGSSHLPMTGGAGTSDKWMPASWKGSSFNKGKTAGHQLERSQPDDSRADSRASDIAAPDTRNRRSVWSISSAPYRGAHFATFPPDLIKPCIMAGTKPGDVVLDPFGGSGTSGMVSLELGRSAILCELNPEYAQLARLRCAVTPGLAFDTIS